MNSIYLEALEEFEALTGIPYRDGDYPSPVSVPAHLLDVVRKVKVSQAYVRQRDIHYQIQAYKKEGVVRLPHDQKHLADDFELWKKQYKQWSGEPC